MSQFNPNSVAIPLTLSYQQVNLLLEGLGKLPFERVENLYNVIRTTGVQAMSQAEAAHLALVNEHASAEVRAA